MENSNSTKGQAVGRRADQVLFYKSALLFSEKDMESLANATVAIAGLGGVGSITAEMLARNGIGSFRLADLDTYETTNLNRQLFATIDSMGQNKAEVAERRLLQINPKVLIKSFPSGVTLQTVRDFCAGADVILSLSDTESCKVILSRVAKELRIPVINGARKSLEGSRWAVGTNIWNYRRHPETPCYDAVKHPELAQLHTLTETILADFDQSIREKKRRVFAELARTNPAMFASISATNLKRRILECSDYSNRHVCAVLANTAGCLVASTTLRVLLNGPDGDLSIDLWTGDPNRHCTVHDRTAVA